MAKTPCNEMRDDLYTCGKSVGHRGWHCDGSSKGMTVEWMSMAAYQAGKWWHRDRGGDRDS